MEQKQENIVAMKQLLKVMVAGAYDFQETRIRSGNRLVGNFKVKLGQDPGTSEEDMEKEAKKLIGQLRADYKNITEGVTTRITEKNFKQVGIISNFSEMEMLSSYLAMEKVEEEHFKRIGKMLNHFPIWTEFLEKVSGIGPALAGVIISNIDFEKATYASSLWKLAGLDVAWDGRGRSKRKEHLVRVDYVTKAGATAEKDSITFKPMLKTKLMGVASASFLRVGTAKSPYAQSYYDYKNRIENHPRHRDLYIALDIEKCKEVYGAIPKKVYRRAYVADMYERCQARVLELTPDISEASLPVEVRKLWSSYLGKYEIYEDMVVAGTALGTYNDRDELGAAVKANNGVLRGVKEVQKLIENEPMDENYTGITVVEEFDETPDSRGRRLFKLMNIGKTKSHRHQMACRYAIKRFLVDLYSAGRALEGLPVMPEYSEAKLGLVHGEASEGKVKPMATSTDTTAAIKDIIVELGTFEFDEFVDQVTAEVGGSAVEEATKYLNNAVQMQMVKFDKDNNLYSLSF